MFKGILHGMAANPVVYDAIQRIAGSRTIYRHLMEVAREHDKADVLLDLGGGTGIYGDVWKNVQLYISLDNDMQKAAGFRNNFPTFGISLLADATNIPLKNNSVDIIQCTALSHHLTDEFFSLLIEESFRVIKKDGIFLFLDAFWLPKSMKSRILWSLDRGSCPKTKELLLSMIETKFKIVDQREIRIYHSYLLCVGKRL